VARPPYLRVCEGLGFVESTPDFELRDFLAAINNREIYRDFFQKGLLEAARLAILPYARSLRPNGKICALW